MKADALLLIFAFIPYVLLNAWKLRVELHMLQLTGYFPERYARWFWTQGVQRLKHAREPYLLFALLPSRAWVGWMIFGIVEILILLGRRDPDEKKPLVMTPRAWRVRICSLLLFFIAAALATAFLPLRPAVAALALLQIAAPLTMFLASWIMLPYEKSVHRYFMEDARRLVRLHPNLQVIGITGSYGKTSTKGILREILLEQFDVLATEGSFNTPMGITRTIRENLRATHEVFLAEMGAREPGNIRELCELTPPCAGILTAIGEQHLETFGSLETLQKTKWELAEALPADGFLVCNVDAPAIRDILEKVPVRAQVIRCGIEAEDANVRAQNIQITAKGLTFDICRNDRPTLHLSTRLLGRHNVLNILLAATTAQEMGVPDHRIRAAVSTLRPTSHRLELKIDARGLVILDNAFSSNPVGAASALEVLRLMEGGKKVLITPGMVELGAMEYECNKAFGRQAAAAADRVLLVGQNRAIPIRDGLREAGFPEDHILVCDNLQAAFAWMNQNLTSGDVILFENDLPDTYLS